MAHRLKSIGVHLSFLENKRGILLTRRVGQGVTTSPLLSEPLMESISTVYDPHFKFWKLEQATMEGSTISKVVGDLNTSTNLKVAIDDNRHMSLSWYALSMSYPRHGERVHVNFKGQFGDEHIIESIDYLLMRRNIRARLHFSNTPTPKAYLVISPYFP